MKNYVVQKIYKKEAKKNKKENVEGYFVCQMYANIYIIHVYLFL